MNSLFRIVRSAIDRRKVVFVVAAAAFVIAARGRLRLGSDASFYLSLADAMLAGKFAIFGTQANFTVVGFTALLASARAITAAHWQSIMLGVNVSCAATTAVLLVGIVRKATSSAVAAVLALGAYIGCFDVFVWVGFLLTDHIYAMISLIVFGLALRGVVAPHTQERLRRVKLWFVSVLAVLARPVGIVLIPVVALTEWMTSRRTEKGSWRALWLFVIAGGIAGLLVHAYYFQDLRRWPVQWLRPKLEDFAALEQSGEVMRGHLEMFHRPPATIADHVMIEVDRFVRFFQITSVTFSRVHNVVAVVYYVPLYAFMLVGIFDGLKSPDRRRSVVVHTALLWIVAMDFFCAANNLDYDWRYRMPLMPQIILLAACGFEAVMRRFLPQSSEASAAAPAS